MVSICDELESQLETWHASIPEAFRPALEVGSLTPECNDREAILRIRYFAARHIINRPFVLYIAMHGLQNVSDEMVEKASRCLDSCRHYIHNTTRILKGPSQYTWTFSQSYVTLNTPFVEKKPR